ncbi:hypothetical protein EYF80_053043 [Liparis tanakae]|uniref:Uncharacterized protein n=1 Tax=Liparis tanakae TaxID=230148 RepID=A0A4Z2F6Q2_9TELE|nr:hypothetical protein EYF80_053043 [Liparis tanakae]
MWLHLVRRDLGKKLIGERSSREELPSGSMPLNDLLADPSGTCETGSDRAARLEGAHFTSNSLPDSPSGREIGPPVWRGNLSRSLIPR